MAHEVESMMYAGEVPWHGLGTHVPEDVSPEEALRIAGLDWEVETVPVHHIVDGVYLEVRGSQLVRRATDKTPYGVVSNRYRLIQNGAFASRFYRALGQDVKIHTAGSLRHGAIVWMLAKINGTLKAAGDDHELYLLGTTGHDGKRFWEIGGTAVRVVCANTLGLAVGTGGGNFRRGSQLQGGQLVRHSGDVEAAMDNATDDVARALGLFAWYQEAAESMSATRISEAEAEDFVSLLVSDAELSSKTIALEQDLAGTFRLPSKVDIELSEYRARRRDEILLLAAHGKGNERHRGTAWALYNGISDHVDHGEYRGSSNAEGRFLSVTEGAGAELKSTAFRYLAERSGAKVAA